MRQTSTNSLCEKVHSGFLEGLNSKLNGKVPDITMDSGPSALLYDISDPLSKTTTKVRIPFGLAQPENNYFPARIDGILEEYDSPQAIGIAAIQIFSNHYRNDIMGL